MVAASFWGGVAVGAGSVFCLMAMGFACLFVVAFDDNNAERD